MQYSTSPKIPGYPNRYFDRRRSKIHGMTFLSAYQAKEGLHYQLSFVVFVLMFVIIVTCSGFPRVGAEVHDIEVIVKDKSRVSDNMVVHRDLPALKEIHTEGLLSPDRFFIFQSEIEIKPLNHCLESVYF